MSFAPLFATPEAATAPVVDRELSGLLAGFASSNEGDRFEPKYPDIAEEDAARGYSVGTICVT